MYNTFLVCDQSIVYYYLSIHIKNIFYLYIRYPINLIEVSIFDNIHNKSLILSIYFHILLNTVVFLLIKGI